MIPVSEQYREAILSTVREFRSKCTISMQAFSQKPAVTDSMTSDFTGKVTASTAENPNIAKYSKQSYLNSPTDANAGWTELTQTYYNNVMTLDSNVFDVYTTTSGYYSQCVFCYNILELIENRYGPYIWQGKTDTASKVSIAKGLITSMTCDWQGFAKAPNKSQYTGFRYIRDWVNGSTANTGNHWIEIQCLASGTNRCTGITATSNKTLTNPLSATDNNTTTYAYDNSATGAAYAQIDLGAVYTDIDTIKIYHYFADGRTYHGTKTEVSADGTTWTTIYDSAVSGEYAETSAGRTYTPPDNTTLQYLAKTAFWNGSGWTNVVANTSSVIAKISQIINTSSLVSSAISADGFLYVLAWSQAANSTVAAELNTDYSELTIQLAETTVRQYDDTRIMRFNTVEEVNILNDSIPADQIQITLDNSDGEFDMLTFTNMPSVLASQPSIGLELGLVTDTTNDIVEWIPSGWFIIIDWTNDITNKIITFTGQDYFGVLTDVSYGPNTSKFSNLHDLAVDVLTTGGVPAENQIIDSRLTNITTTDNQFRNRTDCRTALQNIAIAAQVCVFQDRFGNVVLAPFLTLDQVSNYLLYPTTQNSIIGGYTGNNTYSVINTESGMKTLSYDLMWDVPAITVDKTIYQLVIKQYGTQTDGSWGSTDVVYTNSLSSSAINGVSFTIDNPLVITADLAQTIANWYFNETNYNAHYRTYWRQNPCLECSDIVLIQDPFSANKQSRVYRQEFIYSGYLEGYTESRGGI